MAGCGRAPPPYRLGRRSERVQQAQPARRWRTGAAGAGAARHSRRGVRVSAVGPGPARGAVGRCPPGQRPGDRGGQGGTGRGGAGPGRDRRRAGPPRHRADRGIGPRGGVHASIRQPRGCEELARAAGTPTPTETGDPDSPTPSASAAPAPAAPPPSVAEVADALRQSADSAAALVPTLSGYRAGLLGSIAAACTASYEVSLSRRRPK